MLARSLISPLRIPWLCAALAFAVLSGCTDGRDLDKPAVPLGDFRLGHNVVIAPNLTMGPLSREATQEEWITAIESAIDDRFRRYNGERIYHFGVSVEGYVLAQVGVPLILQPNSVLIFRLTVWDDEAAAKLNAKPKEITVLEAISAESVAGSGLTQTREEQLENLAILAAKQIEEFLVEQKRDARWFRGYRAEGSRAEALESVAISEAAGRRTRAATILQETSVDDLDRGTLEAIVDTANSDPATPAVAAPTALVQEPVEAVTDPEVIAAPEGGN